MPLRRPSCPTTAAGATTSTGPSPIGAGDVGEHGGGLAEAHVERQATAQSGGVEEPEPRQRLGLVAAQLPLEAVELGDRRRRAPSRALEQVGRPTAAGQRHAPAEGPSPSRPRPWRRISAPVSWVVLARSARAAAASFRSTRSSSTQRPRALTSGRACRGEARHLGRGQLDVVEHHRPAHVAELVGADHRFARRLGEQPQPRVQLASRQGRHPHLEPGRLQLGAGDRHQLPRLVLAEHDLPPAEPAGTVQHRQEALQADQLVGQSLGGPALTEGHLDGEQLAVERQGRAPTGARRPHRRARPTAPPASDGRGRPPNGPTARASERPDRPVPLARGTSNRRAVS